MPRHRLAWFAGLVAASILISWGFACAVPLAAFAALAALSMPAQEAFALAGAVWLANQAIGYGVLGYPVTGESLAWGALLGGIALLSTACARAARRGGPVAVFLAAFAAYEGGLYLISLTLMGGTENYTLPIVARIAAINAATFVAGVAAMLLLRQRAGGKAYFGGTIGLR